MSDEHRDYFDRIADDWDKISRINWVKLDHIIRQLDLQPGHNVVDVGTGTGALLPSLVALAGSRGKIWAVDISSRMLEVARKRVWAENVEFVNCGAEQLTLEDDAAERIMCYSCLPHFLDKKKALQEFARVLKPEGKLVIAHADSREAINAMHRSLSGVVSGDVLPEASEMRLLLIETRFMDITIDDSPDRFVITAVRM